MASSNRLKTLLLAIVVVALVVGGLGAGYYFASATLTGTASFPVTWSVRPLDIKFSVVHTFSGSAPDSFICSPSVSPVTLQASSSQPDIISITVSPTSFPAADPHQTT